VGHRVSVSNRVSFIPPQKALKERGRESQISPCKAPARKVRKSRQFSSCAAAGHRIHSQDPSLSISYCRVSSEGFYSVPARHLLFTALHAVGRNPSNLIPSITDVSER
jgi:hypothetical protein